MAPLTAKDEIAFFIFSSNQKWIVINKQRPISRLHRDEKKETKTKKSLSDVCQKTSKKFQVIALFSVNVRLRLLGKTSIFFQSEHSLIHLNYFVDCNSNFGVTYSGKQALFDVEKRFDQFVSTSAVSVDGNSYLGISCAIIDQEFLPT